MSLFANLKTDGLEESQDRLGGYSRPETDVYPATIKAAYAGESTKGAKCVTVIVTLQGGSEYRETIYITNQKGENFFLNKDDKSKKVPLPGFSTIDDLCIIATDKPLAEQATEDKVVNIWDNDAKKELPKSVPVLVDLTGKKVLLAIEKSIENKTEKQGDQYVATSETREVNAIAKVFHPELRVSVVEAKQGKTEGAFIDSWIERNKGKTRDKREIKDGPMNGQNGAPRAANGPPQAGGGTARKSLFGQAA